jgi:hypothetical protein
VEGFATLKDVGRKRNLAVVLEDGIEIVGKFEDAFATGTLFNDGGMAAIGELDLIPRVEAFCGASEAAVANLGVRAGAIFGLFGFFEEEKFYFSSSGDTGAIEPGGNNPCFVEHEEVSGSENIDEIPENAVLRWWGFGIEVVMALDDQKTGFVAALGGVGRQQLVGQVVGIGLGGVEIHRGFIRKKPHDQ